MMDSLVSLYFLKVNGFIPLLHRPTFKDGVNQRLHIHDPRFATVVLLVCALGSLHLAEPAISKQDREELAWKCYNQVELCGHSLRQQPTLYDIQDYCVRFQFV
jgi:hypothetical protein